MQKCQYISQNINKTKVYIQALEYIQNIIYLQRIIMERSLNKIVLLLGNVNEKCGVVN